MKHIESMGLALVLAVFSLPVRAQEAVDVPQVSNSSPRAADVSTADEHAVDAYCRYAEAVADSDSALSASPWLFGNVGTLAAARGALPGEATDNVELGTPRLRVQAGVGVSPTRILRSGSARTLARLECRQYAVNAKIKRVLELLTKDVGHVGAAPLREKARVLREALERGRKLNELYKQRLEASLATVDDFRKLVLKLSEIEQALHATEDELARQPERVPLAENWAALRAESERVAAESARVEGGVRKSQAFEVVLRGGYDRIFGVDQRVPLFASATLRFSPGWFWQAPAESRAEVAAKEWRARQAQAALPAPREFIQRIEARMKVAADRRSDLARTIGELDRRLNDVKAVPGEASQRFAELLWLDIAMLRADEAFVAKQREDLEGILSGYREIFR
ncbi:MAG: hypothetical protein ACOY0T_20745 [Myxococcota bacterium]